MTNRQATLSQLHRLLDAHHHSARMAGYQSGLYQNQRLSESERKKLSDAYECYEKMARQKFEDICELMADVLNEQEQEQ